MTDFSTYLMLDDVNVSTLEAYDAPAYAVAGYVNGLYANWSQLVAHYAGTSKFLLSIDVVCDVSAGAQCLDVEPTDATNAQAPAWVKGTAAAGRAANDLRYYPKVYTSYDNCQALVAALTAAGIPRSGYMLWSAHYTNVAHICGPSSCGLPVQADATQYTDTYAGASLDGSMCYGYFFAGPPNSPSPSPAPVPKPLPAFGIPQGITLASTDSTVVARWDAVSEATSYHVQLCGAGGKVLYDDSTSATTFTFTGCTASSEYQFRIAVHANATHESSQWTALQKIDTKAVPKPAPAPAPKPAPKPAPTPEPELMIGDTGEAVRLLQQLLNGRPIRPNLTVDGIFGTATRSAVMLVQQNNGVTVDGIVGPVTWAILGNYS